MSSPVTAGRRKRVMAETDACALIDISPLYKYLITGKDATKLRFVIE